MDLSKNSTSPEKETKGVEVQYDAETKFIIGSVNSTTYKNALRRRSDELRRLTRNASPEQNETMLAETYAEAIILGWEGVLDNGKPLPYSRDSAKRIMLQCPTVRDFIMQHATDYALFRAESVEEQKKAVGESSLGN